MDKDVEQRRAEIREESSDQTAVGEESKVPERHDPLSGLVGNRIRLGIERT
jgi:hypothetical protein